MVQKSKPGGSEIFPTSSYRPLGPTHPPVKLVPGSVPQSEVSVARR